MRVIQMTEGQFEVLKVRRFAEAARYARDLETNEIADQPTAG